MRSTWSYGYGNSWRSSAVKTIILINVSLFVLNVVFTSFFSNPIIGHLFELSPRSLSRGYVWQVVSYMFFHYDALHLLFNLLVFYFFGREIEYELGPRKLWTLYLLGGLLGGALWLAFNFYSGTAVIGASGAVFSVLIAYATLHPDRPLTFLLFFVVPVNLLAKHLAMILVAFSVVFLFAGRGNVAELAHLGGIATGYLYVKFLLKDFNFLDRFTRNLKGRFKRPTHLRVVPHSADEKSKSRYMREDVDPILDKIAKHGIQSLTPEERRVLDEAKDRLP